MPEFGHKKAGGRRKGTPNKSTLAVQEMLDKLGCDPIEVMAKIAMNRKNPPELRGKMASELAKYIHPQRKAVEHTGPGGSAGITVIVRSVLDASGEA